MYAGMQRILISVAKILGPIYIFLKRIFKVLHHHFYRQLVISVIMIMKNI